jgi:hypothetical protein
MSFRAVILILLFGVLGPLLYFGVIDLGGTDAPGSDKASVPESRSCPGYKLIRRFKADGVISSYRAIQAEAEWDCEYAVNDGAGVVGFAGTNSSLRAGFVAGGTTHTQEARDLEEGIADELDKLGFESE